MTTNEVLKLALEALEAGEYYIDDLEAIVYAADDLGTHEDRAKMQLAITALREALANEALDRMAENARELGLDYELAQQEPVTWGVDWGKAGDASCVSIIKRLPDGRIEVVAVEYGPQRTWQGLTDEEAFQICVDCGCLSEDWLTLLDAIEAKLRSKNA